VEDAGQDVPLDVDRFAWVWIVKLNYLAEDDTTATVRMGPVSADVRLRRGAHTLYVELNGGEGGTVRVEGHAADVAVCVDRLTVGTLQAREGS
jgi:hypothetical protein